MALYWPEQKVALDIVDDPQRRPFEGDDSYTVVRVTCAELYNYDSYRKIADHLCKLLGHEHPASSPEWEERCRTMHEIMMSGDLDDAFISLGLASDPLEADDGSGDPLSDVDDLEVVVPSQEMARFMEKMGSVEGHRIRGASVWEGPVPKGSFTDLSPTMRMSTAEFFYLRKANQLPLAKAVWLANELCGKFGTRCTIPSEAPDEYEFFTKPRSTKARLRKYLRGARGTKEGKRAKRVLRYVLEECSSPAGCYIVMRLCLPSAYGGYGLEHALCSVAFQGEGTLMPSSSGPFLAYDLCWPDKLVAVQYTGARKADKRALAALNAGGMRTVCVRDVDLKDPVRFDKLARRIARLLDAKVPGADDEQWLEARKQLCADLPAPTFEAMRLTLDDIDMHRE